MTKLEANPCSPNESPSSAELLGETADAALANRVRHCLLSNRNDFRPILVRAEAGTACLSGTVRSFFLRQMAVALTKRVPEVLQVVDDLNVDVEPIDAIGADKS